MKQGSNQLGRRSNVALPVQKMLHIISVTGTVPKFRNDEFIKFLLLYYSCFRFN